MKTPMEQTAMNPAPAKIQRSRSTPLRKFLSGGSLIALLAVLVTSAWDVAVAASAVDGDGIMTVSPTSVTYGSTGNTLTFTFTANNDFGAGTQVALTIPAGWTPPTTAAGAGHIAVDPGTATLSGSPPFAITGSIITIDMASCPAGHYFTVTYSGVAAPAITGSPYTFTTQTDIGTGGGGLVNTTAPFPVVTVDPATLTVGAAGLTPENKIYDGTTAATLVPGSPTLVGIVGSDIVSLVTGGATGTFADRNIGTNKTVTIAGLTLTGANAGNYILTQPTRSANIATRPITVNAVADTKTYDGTNISIGVPTLSGGTPLAPGDTAPAWTQSFDNRNAGTGKTLTPGGAVVDGNNGLNYAYTLAPNTSGVITPKAITVTAATDSKVYDGTTSSSGVPILSPGTPLAPGDTAPAWVQAFDTKNVGTAKSLTPAGRVIDGNGGLNYAYNFIPATTGIITAAPLTITANNHLKTYGQTVTFAGTEFTASGLTNADTVSSVTLTSSGAAASATVGGSPYSIVPSAATGTGLGNYNITYANGTLTLNPAPLVVTPLDASRAYGQTNPVFAASYSGFVNGQTNTVLGGTLVLSTIANSSSPVGTYPITASGLTAIDYSITYSNGTLTITAPAPMMLSPTVVSTAEVLVTWTAVSNGNYRVQYKSVLGTTNWTDLIGDVTATGNTASKTDSRTSTNRFYRVQVLP